MLLKVRDLWKRPDTRFLILFLSILGVSFFIVALNWVNDAFVVPYTGFVAKMSGVALTILGEDTTVNGVVVSSPRFAVTIYNGCNGLVTSLIFISGVLAFPSSIRSKAIGVLGGLVSIQIINLVRIVSLFFIGIYLPQYFSQSHVFIWQSIVIVAGVALWVLWAHNYGISSIKRN
ncbi:MAG: exosortase H [bacterium]|nr:exosortase H [bacterium]